MEKIKIFVYDTLCLGFPDSITYLKNQTFLFPAFTGKGYALFFTGNVYLVRDEYFHGGYGELFEVTPLVLNEISKRMVDKMNFTQEEINVYQDGNPEPIKAITWIMDRAKLQQRRLKCIHIKCFRDMSPCLSKQPYPGKSCC